ncbi:MULTISPECIES: phage tail tip fiber protein [Klebsiella]|uniref:phage tail tip fiber protein n=1 Tax=Klebsiella TaxID=570 RepID=UPI00351B09AE
MEVPNFKKNRLSQMIAHGLAISGRGGSKGGGSSRTPVEANDTVNSRAMASVLDLLGEGVIGGLVDGAKSIFLNDTPLQNSDNSYNFSGVTWWFRDGSQDQSVIEGFDFIETPKSIGRQLKQTSQVNVSLDSADSDRVRVVMKFPSLRSIDKKSGDTNGTTVQFKFQIDAGNGKGFVDVVAEGESGATISLTAKKTGVYYRSYVIDLPKPAKIYTLRAIRLTGDHPDNSYLYDDTYIDSIGEIVNTSLNYPNSALVGLKINSEQFGSSMPSRSYLINGLKIRVPSNYYADTNTYNGNWDGTFKLASSSNPAWILFDLLTNTRYGLGQFVQESMINIGELYQIGRYCDATVDDGFGGKEKRFSINTQITSRQDAYRVVQDIAGAFRGMVFWAGGMVHITQDSPSDPVMLFSNSNVVNGLFAYKGSARKDRYSVALITYNNKEDGYKQSVEYVEDQEAIKRYGIRKTESVAFGCTSRGQAHRVGLWILYTSRMESDVITFSVGMDSVFLMPGDVVLIADKFRAGRRNSGRITGYTANSIKLDAPVDLTSVGNHITFLSSEGKVVERDILENGKNITTVTFKTALRVNETPVNDAVWVIAQPELVPLQARVMSVTEGSDGLSFNITAIQNNPTKYEAIDNGAQLIPQNTTVLDPTYSKPSGLVITEGTYLSSPGNLSVSLTATWQGKSSQYYISWRRSDAGNVSNWKSQRVTEEQFELREVAENGQYDFQVYAVSVGGRKTDPISITYKVLGTLTAPNAPTGLTAVGDYRSIVLNWVNPSSVDLDHIEVLASKINDKAKAGLVAKVSGTTFTHNGLEDSVTWYYWVRAANKRGMLSALNSPLATTATTRDVLSFLKNKITESELGKDLLSDIDSKAIAKEVDAAIDEAKSEAKAQVDDARTEAANAVKSAKDALSTAIDKETLDRAQAIADEAAQRAQDIAKETADRSAAITDEAKQRAQAVANETTARNKAIADEASIRATAISNEVTTRTNAIAAEVDARTKAVADEATARNKAIAVEADARKQAVTDEATARAKAVSDEAIARASAITDSVAIEASNRAKAVADATAALDTKISKEASDRASAVSALDTKTANAINTETSNRISSIESEARARADALLQEKNNRQSEISNLSTQVQTANESLAQQMSQIAAGTGEQFDSLNIWYFDTNNEGWTEDDGSTVPMAVTDDGWLKSSNSTASFRSPNNMIIDANAYRFLKLRIKKVGKPTWSGKLYWIGASEQGWSESRSLVIDEPEYDANGVATLTIHDIDWRASATIRRFRFDFLKNQSDTNNLLIDWIAVGRPTPGAGMAALQDEKTARVNADAAEAANRSTLAVQMRGSYEGNDLSKVGSGLIYQEQQARVTADKAEATARQSLETKVNDSVSNINKSLDTLNTQDKAMASDITGIKSSLGNKADASALQTLKTSVEQQGSNISTQGQSITKLQNDLNTIDANVGKKADQSAMTALQGTVTQQGKDISSANSNITNLKTSLDTTNNNVAKKADANAVSDLASRVSSTEGKVSSQADSIIQLNNSLSNAVTDADFAKKMPTNLIVNSSFERGTEGYTGISSSSTVVSLQSPRTGSLALKIAPGSVAPGQNVDFVKDRTYEIGVWVKQIAGTTDGGNGNNKLRVGNSAGSPVFELPFTGVTDDWTKFSKRWKATETGSLPVTLNNYLTAGNRYFDDFYVIDVTDSVNIDANASALSSLQNTVTQQGKDISSQSTSITELKNSLKSTNDNVSKKADASAVQTLQNTVTQQGKDLTTAGSNITSLQNGLDTTNTNVSKKADATALNALQNTVTQQGSSISSQGNSITQLKNNVDSLSIGASNLLRDSDKSSAPALCLSPASNFASFELKAISGLVGKNISVKTQYTMTLWFKEYADGFGTTKPFTSAIIGRSAATADSWSLRYYSQNGIVTRDGDLYKWVGTITAESGSTLFVGVAGLRFLFEDKTQKTGCQVYRVKLEEGNKSTTWSPASEDLSDAISGNSQALNSLDSRVTKAEGSITSQGNSITQLQNGLTATNANVSKKADASALTSLQNTVTQQGKDLSSASSNISSLKNSLATTDANVAKKADSSALSSLQNTVTQQGKDLSSVGNRTTNLENNLKTTDANVSKKADASAVDSLQNTVTQQGKDITSASDAITSLNNSVGAMTNMGDNLIQDANLEGDGSAFRTQQNSGTTGSIVAFGAYGESSAGARMLKVNATSPGLFANGKKPTPINGARKFRYVVRAKGVSGAMNMLLRRWNYAGSREGSYLDKNVTLTTDWQTIIWDSSFALSADTDGQAFGIYCHPNNAEIWIDSFTVFDITDATNNDATASALSDLSTKVTKQGDTVSSQGTAITNLQNDLTSARADVAKKADATALQTLQNTVIQQGKDLTSQSNSLTTLNNSVNTVKGDVAKKADTTALNGLATRVTDTEKGITSNSDAITSLNNSLSQQSKRGANILPDGTFESYSNGYNLSNGRVIVTTDGAQSGSKCIRVTRSNNYSSTSTDNNDSHIFSGFSVRDNAVFYIECWVKLDAAKADMAPGTQLSVGMSIQYQDNSWQWPAVTKAVKDLSATEWTKVYGYLKLSKSGVKQSMVRISIPNVSTVRAGDAFLIDNIVITEVTDAYNAQTLSDANASALQTLGTTVDKQGSDITSQGTAITKLQNDLGTTNANVSKKADATALQTLQNTVTDQGKTLTSQGSAITTLNNTVNSVKSDVAKKAEAAALQTLSNTVTQQGKDITSTSNGVTSLTNSLATTDANVAKKADSSALTALQSTVTQQGKDITSANSNITTLKNSLASTDANVAKKADASALSSLQNAVTQQGKDIVSTTNSLSTLSNQFTNGKENTWSRRVYKLQLANSAIEPTFSDIQGLSPYLIDEVADATKLDFASAGSYVVAYYKAFVRVTTDTKITMSPGSRVFDDTGVVYVNGSRAAAGGANNATVEISLSAGWNTIEILINQWTGNAYVNMGLKVSDKVQEMYSGLGVAALSNAVNEANSNVSKVGDAVTSNSSNITKLTNSLASTDANVAKKADSSALSSLQNTVVQQGKDLSSQGNSITSLQNSLNTTDGKVAKKAEQSAVDSLTGRVTKTESDITAANSSVTSLNAAIRAGNASSGDLIPNPTFDPAYNQMGFNIVSTDSAGVPAGCPFKYAAKISSRDHHPNFNTIVATAGDVFEISVLVACGVGAADFNLYIGSASGPTGGIGAPLYAGGNTKTTSSWKRVTWRATVPQSAADKGYLRPFLQINQSSPFGTVWYVTDWHMRNITAAANAQNTADTTAKAVDSLTSTVNQQGKDITSVSSRATTLENGLSTANGNIGKKADASALSSLQNTVTQQGKDLTSQGNSITSLQNSLNTTNSNVSKKADSSALSSLQNTVNQQGNTIGSHGSQITMLSNSITEGSLIGNGGLSVDASMWTDSGNGSAYTYDAAEKAIRSTTGSIRVANITRIPVEAGTALTLMFDLKMSENVTAYSADTVGFIASLDDPTNWLVSQSSWLNGVTTAWQTKTITLTIPDNFTGSYVYLRFAVGSWTPAASARLYLRKVDVSASNGVAKKADASAVNTLSSRVDSVQGSVTSQGSQITNLQHNLSTTNANVAKKADATALQTLQNTVTQQGKDISSTNSSVTSLKSSLDTTNANVAKKADTTALQSLQNTVTQQGKDITSANSSITNLKSSLDTTNANVSKKADSTALQTLQNTVAQQGKDLSSQSNSITNLSNTLNDVSVGGTNLIPLSGTMDGWGGRVSETYRGNAVITATVKANNSYRDLREITLDAPIDGEEYVYSFYAKAAVAGQNLTVFFYNPNTTTVSENSQGVKTGNTDGRSPISLTTEWVRYWVKWKQKPGTGTKRLILGRMEASTEDQTVYLSSPKMEAGNMMTEWSPAPSDLASAGDLSTLKTTVDANSSALQSVTSRVSNAEGKATSQGTALTNLQNSLSTTNGNVAKKADTSALQSLQNTVTQQGKDITASGANVTALQASLNRRTVFTITARGNGSSAKDGIFDESGAKLFTAGRSYGLVTFKLNTDGSTSIGTSKSYDVFGAAANGKALSDDIAALANGTYACVMTLDEPTTNRSSVAAAVELLGGTSEVINSLPYRGAYILLGRKGMKAGDGLELRSPTGSDQGAFVSTSVEFVNGVMLGLGAAGGVMMKADANASAISTLQNTVTQQGKDITSSSSSITSLQNALATVNANISKKADATALSSLQNAVTQQGKDLASQGSSLTELTNNLNSTNASIDAAGQIPGNMITNASFERANGGYNSWGGPVSVMTAQSPHSGTQILKIGVGDVGAVGQKVTYVKDRTYQIGVWARQDSSTIIRDVNNTKFRIADNNGLIASFAYGPFTTVWQEISFKWKATKDVVADTQITAYLSAGFMYFDDFYVIDITDRVDLDATSSALTTLTSRVTSAEGTVSSHSGSITSLNNTLSSLNKTVSGKADASALQSLQNTVTQQGKDLSSASGSVTDLQSSLNTLKVQSNPWIDGTFETYSDGAAIGGNTAVVTTAAKFSGGKCLKITRPSGTSGNSDKMIGSYSAVRQGAKYRVEFMAMMTAGENPSSGWVATVGIHSVNKDGGNDWKGVAFNESMLGARDVWVKFSDVITLSDSVTRSQVWMSTRGANGSGTPGYSVYIDDLVITDVTDAAEAQQMANVNATAISSLQTKTSDIDGKITAQTSQLTSMQSKVDASSSKVDQLSKTLSDSQSSQASLNTSLQSQIDAQASANIKNQAELNSAVTSIASIKSIQSTQATQLSAVAKSQTDMTVSLNNQSASIQTLQEAVSNNDALNSTWMVKMETNSAGKKYAAGIALGVDGKNQQSQFLVQADRFALINTSSGNTTTPFVIDNGVTYMSAAYIKDGSISSAKVGDLMSNGFQENVRGWRISRDGTMNINGSGAGGARTTITNGKIEVYDSNNRLRVRMGIF